ncbi:hypothetical protein [Hymenobacter guriensis]|uniref:Uncharacterized protein n=1 Tax=Hymenobacter guriensis TaxID=2793065 RepID=A0ABS0KY50_9BACT|nr:hypothetical protein [Hymenobacter guriensis]MBG8552803.1 hypothetical protein [Hymenobacter guriensis]
MKLSEQNMRILLKELRAIIDTHAAQTTRDIVLTDAKDLIQYPLDGGLTREEIIALKKLKVDQTLTSALQKVFVSNAAGVIFDLFCLIDGVSDPNSSTGWTGVMLVDEEEGRGHYDFLHDEFFDSSEEK